MIVIADIFGREIRLKADRIEGDDGLDFLVDYLRRSPRRSISDEYEPDPAMAFARWVASLLGEESKITDLRAPEPDPDPSVTKQPPVF